MRIVAYNILDRTSAEALAITCKRGSGSASRAFSRNRRKTFSTSTIASSTTMPMATAMPPSVMLLTPTPAKENTNSVIAKDRGIAVSVISVVRRFNKNSSSTRVTMIAPSRIASLRLPMACEMKSPCRNKISASTPGGIEVFISASAFSISCVRRSVSNPGDLSMLMITPALSSLSPGNPTAASPRIG